MNILSANLKHLYQRRSFWLLGLSFGAVAFGIVMAITQAVTRHKQDAFSAPILWMLFVSAFIATLPIDVLTKPFSYCLPNHRNMPRKFLFSIGLMLSFLWSLSFLFYPDLNMVETALACLSAFSTFTICYWLGAWCVFTFRRWGVSFALLPLIMLCHSLLNVSTVIVHTIVESPLLMILSGGIVNFLAWRYWGRSNLARRYCGILWMGAFDSWNKEKISKLRQAGLTEKAKKNPGLNIISSGVERFFVSQISHAETGSLHQYIWGTMYKSFGVMISQQKHDWMRFFALMLPILCFLGYTGPGGHIIFLMPGIMVVHMSLNVHSGTLISGGRRERFWSALTLAAASAILITFLVTFIAALTIPLELVLPELTIKGKTFAFHALSIKLFLIPLLMIPVTLTIGLIFHKKPTLAAFFTILFFLLLFTFEIFRQRHNQVVHIGLVPIIVIMIFCCNWIVFVAVLRYISMRCCLVKQSK